MICHRAPAGVPLEIQSKNKSRSAKALQFAPSYGLPRLLPKKILTGPSELNAAENLGAQHMKWKVLLSKVKAPRAILWEPQATGLLLGNSLGYWFKQLSLLGTYITYLVAPKGLVYNMHFKYTFISFFESFTATNEPNKLTFSSQLSWYWALTVLAEAMGSNPVRVTKLVSRVCLVTGYKRRGGEWYLEKCGSRKILAGSQNLESVFDKSQSLVFSWFVFTLLESRNFLSRSLGLGFLTRILASRRVSDFTICHPEERPWQRGCPN